MDNLDELHSALVKADAAGDTASAKALADHIRSISAAPAAAPSMLENAWDGAKNLGLGVARGVMDPIDGGAQLLTKGLSSGLHAIAPGSSADTYMQGQAADVSNINNDREAKYQAMTPGSFLAGAGRVGGNVIVPLPGGSAAEGVSTAAKLGNALKTGAIVGASQPVLGDQSNYWHDKAAQVGIGATLGGALTGAGKVAGAAYNTVRPIVSPSSTVGNMLADTLTNITEKPGASDLANLGSLSGSSNPSAVLARLKAAQPLVPGSLPTTAQVAGVPELVMAEKTLKNNPAYRGAFEDRSIANNQARLNSLQGIARTPADLASALDARATQTGPMYDAAKAAALPVNDELSALLARPSAQQAIARGQKIAAERGEAISPEAGTSAQPSAILDAGGKPFAGTPAQSGTISGNMLQYMKMGLDDMQTSGRTQGIGTHEANALSDTQDALHKWIENNSPTYAAANKAYAAGSQPVNTMQAAQDLYKGLSSGTMNAAGDVAPALSNYRAQLAKALKASTYGIDPEAQKALEAIQSDMQRETISNSIKSGGSDTYFNAQAPNWLSGQLFGKSLDGKSMAGRGAAALGGLLTGGPMGAVAGAVGAQKIGEFAGNRVNTQFQKAMLDPHYFAKLLGEALDRQSGNPSRFESLAPSGARAATVGAEGVFMPSR